MQKFNICTKFVRKYSGEYSIFNFPGFGNKAIENNCTKNKLEDPVSGKCLQPTSGRKATEPVEKRSKLLEKVKDTAEKLLCSKDKKPETTSTPKPQCGKIEPTNKPEKVKCLRPVPRPMPVTEVPEDCNVQKQEIPKIKLSDGYVMPMFGLGTWGSKPHKVTMAVMHAIKVGYRMIDCAHVYENEQAVGKAINDCIKKCIVKRDEIFITSKLWNTYHRPEMVVEGCCRSLKDLNLSYLNLYLIHWPMGYKEGKELIPYDACGRILSSRVDYVDTWQAMEDLVQRGFTRSIGISNFNMKQIERILKIAKIKPVVNQVECHPYLNQMRLMAYLKKKKIALVAYSPLGSPARPWAKPDEPYVLDDNMIKSIAFQQGRTAAQVCIRYQIQRGNAVIPKSVTPSRIESNFEVADFELGDEEMKIIDKLDKGFRVVPLSKLSSHPYYPFHDAY
ncbi:aldo-keto reductase family 1 member B1-like [Anastrepha ludens]|uniref:aldo-keto reductase family 1 member B1-like n=1 Tax=Anastrepha ludens TaxID=28586 RepID=UPI0023B0AB2E|nr:aldo-keto reductase family 1 member B1-like [Anastrepha ludens]